MSIEEQGKEVIQGGIQKVTDSVKNVSDDLSDRLDLASETIADLDEGLRDSISNASKKFQDALEERKKAREKRW